MWVGGLPTPKAVPAVLGFIASAVLRCAAKVKQLSNADSLQCQNQTGGKVRELLGHQCSSVTSSQLCTCSRAVQQQVSTSLQLQIPSGVESHNQLVG